MRRVLLVSPHFPPDSTAATHRVRLLAPHLARYGWEPTVLTVEASAYEGELDPALPGLIAGPVRVVHARALSPRLTRRVGIGDLGLRSLVGLYRAAARLLARERFDAVFITIFPAYTALLGPLLVRRFGVPFVLDYQDPWVNASGDRVGVTAGRRADWKARASRLLAERLEPFAVRAASAITAVSPGTYEPILARNPAIRPITAAIPIGAEPRDFGRDDGAGELPFDSQDGCVHLCATGALLPLGVETLRAVLGAVRRLGEARPGVYRRLRLHFIGTSNQTTSGAAPRVLPIAREMGVDDVVSEWPSRVPYSTAVRIQRRASALLAMGSSEWHYTPSKVYPLLLARRPLVAVYHEQSAITATLRRIARPPSVRLVTYSDEHRAEARVDDVADALAATVERPEWREADLEWAGLAEFFAENLAGRLAGVLDQVVGASAA